MPNLEITRRAVLTRQQVADRLITWGNALASGSEVQLESGDDSIKIAVADEVQWELEIEIDGAETEIEIELKWRDRPASEQGSPELQRSAADDTGDNGSPVDTASVDAATPDPPKPRARRGRPRTAAS